MRCQYAILPIIAMIGIDVGTFMSGIVVVESVFGWPGIGQLAWQAIQKVDIPHHHGGHHRQRPVHRLGQSRGRPRRATDRPAYQTAITFYKERRHVEAPDIGGSPPRP